MPARFTLPDELRPEADAQSGVTPSFQPPATGAAPERLVESAPSPQGGDMNEWLEVVRSHWRAGDAGAAESAARAAVEAFPGRAEPILECAALLRACGRVVEADTLLLSHVGIPDVALERARQLRGQGRVEAACELVDSVFRDQDVPPEPRARLCRFLEESGRQEQAFAQYRRAAERADAGSDELANAARLAMQLGHFTQAREWYARALALGLDHRKWNVAEAMASCQRYDDAGHPDLALFRRWSREPGLQPLERAAPLFALGKAHDDLEQYPDAATCWGEANALLRQAYPWDADAWQRQLAAVRAEAWASPSPSAAADWVPVFVVGMPRSGTTLVAALLARQARVRNRGERMWIPELHEQIARGSWQRDRSRLAEAADYYRRMMVQDDAPARWYIDKQTFNFLHLGMLAALFPQAHVVYCSRDPRDTALSIWAQHFGGAAAAFTYDLDAVLAIDAGCRDLMCHWQEALPLPVHAVAYEELVDDPQGVLDGVCAGIGIDRTATVDPARPDMAPGSAVTTASMWQVRQAITSRSVGRWRNYVKYLPALATGSAAAAGD